MFIEIKRNDGSVLYLNETYITTIYIEKPSKETMIVHMVDNESYRLIAAECDQVMDQLKRIQSPLPTVSGKPFAFKHGE